MVDRVMTVPLGASAHQVTVADASSGSAGAGVMRIVIVDTTTNDAVIRGLRVALEAARRAPSQMTGV